MLGIELPPRSTSSSPQPRIRTLCLLKLICHKFEYKTLRSQHCFMSLSKISRSNIPKIISFIYSIYDISTLKICYHLTKVYFHPLIIHVHHLSFTNIHWYIPHTTIIILLHNSFLHVPFRKLLFIITYPIVKPINIPSNSI